MVAVAHAAANRCLPPHFQLTHTQVEEDQVTLFFSSTAKPAVFTDADNHWHGCPLPLYEVMVYANWLMTNKRNRDNCLRIHGRQAWLVFGAALDLAFFH